VPLGRVAPDPVGDVQGAVGAQRGDVVDGDGVGLAGALQHEELRQDGDGLEPDAEGPEDLERRVLVGEEQREHRRAEQQVLHAEGVEGRGLRGLVRRRHQVEGVAGGGEEEQLEERVVVV